jgi:putative membrane protein
MTKLLLRWALLAFSVFAASLIVRAIGLGFKVSADTPASIFQLLIGVAILSFLNATLGRILKFMTLPLSCITLGLFSLVVNACVLWLAASLGMGFRITQEGGQGFLSAFVASILISVINGVLGVLIPDDKDK